MRHSQALGKRERLVRAANASFKKHRRRAMLRKLERLQEAQRLREACIPACANCHCVEVPRTGMYCFVCGNGMH